MPSSAAAASAARMPHSITAGQPADHLGPANRQLPHLRRRSQHSAFRNHARVVHRRSSPSALALAREIKAHAPHCRVILTLNEMKRLGRDAAELTALADHLVAHGLVLEMLAGPLPGIYDPTGAGRILFAFFAALAETERDNIREGTLEGLDAAARQGKHGGRPPVITDDMLHTIPRRRAAGETVEQIRPDLIIPTGRRKGRNPSVASIYRAITAYEKTQAYPDAVEQAHAEHAQRAGGGLPAIVRPQPARVLDPTDPELASRIQGRPLDRHE
jgi:DNA invertase Pin-like site-specific DNA recombinase